MMRRLEFSLRQGEAQGEGMMRRLEFSLRQGKHKVRR